MRYERFIRATKYGGCRSDGGTMAPAATVAAAVRCAAALRSLPQWGHHGGAPRSAGTTRPQRPHADVGPRESGPEGMRTPLDTSGSGGAAGTGGLGGPL